MATKSKKTRNVETLPTEPRPRFVALSNRRMTGAVKAIKGVGKIARSKPLDYNSDDIVVLRTALNKAVNDAIAELEAGLQKTADKEAEPAFDFDAVAKEVLNSEE